MADTTGHLPATTVDPPPPPEVLVDRLSDLPEHLLIKILSLLPTHLAARTSCLSRRFRHLWSASPSLYFDCSSYKVARFLNKMVNCALLGRDCSDPLESLRIISGYNSRFLPLNSVERWIGHAAYLGVRHLHLELEAATVSVLCRYIFSIRSLESLHISHWPFEGHKALIPPDIVSTRLKSLYLQLNMDSADLTRLIRGLPILECLELRGIDQSTIDISSLSVKTLKLECGSSKLMKLCFPKLVFMDLRCQVNDMEMFQGEMPLVSKAKFHLIPLTKLSVLVLESMLKSAANAVQLKLSIQALGLVEVYPRWEMQLCFPRLECLQFSCSICLLKLFQGEMPVLRKADICLSCLERFGPALSGFLKNIANVVDLKLRIYSAHEVEKTYFRCIKMQLSLPRLEYLDFSCDMCCLKLFQAEMPVLRKADICLSSAKEEFVPPVSGFLKLIANAVDLKLTVEDDLCQLKPFHILVSYKKPPLFSRLINFELSAPCHEDTIKDVINLLENAPVLNCLKMHHRDPCIDWNEDKKKIYWQSKLPRNSEGNFQHACFTDLHIRDDKSHAIKLLSRRLTSKK